MKTTFMAALLVVMIVFSGCDNRYVPVTLLFTAASDVNQRIELDISVDGETRWLQNNPTSLVAVPILYAGMSSDCGPDQQYYDWAFTVTIIEETGGSEVTLYLWKEIGGENYSLELIDTQAGSGIGETIVVAYTYQEHGGY